MPDQVPRRIALTADLGAPTSSLLARLSPAEQSLVACLPTDRQRRHSAVARLAGERAVRRLPGHERNRAEIEILRASSGAPLVSIDGKGGLAFVSLAHSGRLAAAFSWVSEPGCCYSAGIDLEQIRASEVASSAYAFSGSERRMIACAECPSRCGLAAWSAKEAAWKAMRPEPECGPDTVEICRLDLRRGLAVLKPRGKLRTRFPQATIWAHWIVVSGPDGLYILSLAEIDCRTRHVSVGLELPAATARGKYAPA
jgi:4'-phosphopantetheinyl transferase EntD